ncbi:MAG: hypothetical protein HW403_359, partial [Dehalococcoidia bacterium]|nr:hypothetical protein [Dehalococcoidia bacterium]
MKKRDKRSNISSLKIFSIGLAVLAGLAWGFALYYKPILAVSEVRVQGAQVMDSARVVQQLDLVGQSILA